MNGGSKAKLLVSCLAFGGCTAAPPVEVRAIDPAAAISKGGDEVAVARGQLVLGNAGLALEAFRKAQRNDPNNSAVLAGIGDCYSAMGRYDLAQSNYEAALAFAPHDRTLLLGLASIYEREGNRARAMIARAEAAAMQPAAAAPTPNPIQTAAAVPAPPVVESVAIPKPSLGSITVELPVARPVDRVEARVAANIPSMPQLVPEAEEQNAVSAIPEVQPTAPVREAAAEPVTVALPVAAPAADLKVGDDALVTQQLVFNVMDAPSAPAAPAQVVVAEERSISRPRIGAVTVELPAPKPAERLEARAAPVQPSIELVEQPVAEAAATPIASDQPAPAPLPRRPDRDVAVVDALAPRLERLSRGEVALVTTGKPIWRSSANVRTASGTSVRWVTLASAPGRPNIKILNAARSQGLAASARTVLSDRGWRKIAIGDAPAALRKSVVLYPKGKAALGRRLAGQFGVSAQVADRVDVVLVLGRDAVSRIARPQRS